MDCIHESTNLVEGDMALCPDCECFIWKAKNQHTYLVPHFRRGIEGIELHPATNQHESAEFRRGIIERTRLNMGLNGLKPMENCQLLSIQSGLGKYDTRR